MALPVALSVLRSLAAACAVLFSLAVILPGAHAAKARTKRGPAAQSPAKERGNGVPYAHRPDAMQAADDIASRRDLDRQWVRQVIGQARLLPQITRWVLPAAAGTPKNWRVYRSRFIDPVRIAAGVAFWQAHAATLSFDFPDAHPRAAERRAFFQNELEQLLSLAHRTSVDPLSLRGSYAGAMGLPQFMPSSWARYAIDFDGDGRVDLYRSPADVIGSVANYFKAFGWQPGMPTHYPVQFDTARLDLPALLAPDILPTFSAAGMAGKGMLLGPQGQQHSGPMALVELQNGDDTPQYLAGTENFYAITRYNWSSYYALAVIELGQEVAKARTR